MDKEEETRKRRGKRRYGRGKREGKGNEDTEKRIKDKKREGRGNEEGPQVLTRVGVGFTVGTRNSELVVLNRVKRAIKNQGRFGQR